MIIDILSTAWFFLGAGIANMVPVLAKKWQLMPKLNQPIDRGAMFRGKRVLGDNKTIRGFVVGWIVAIIIVLLQVYLYNNYPLWQKISLVDYNQINPFILATALAFGALGGDAIKSFFKRQNGIQPGKSWVPFDQLDYVVGTIIFTYPIVQLSLKYYLIAVVLGLLVHPLANIIGWLIGVKDKPL